jgi:hypothetical protein
MTAVVPERPASRQVVTAPWLVGLALSLVVEDCDEDVAIKQLVMEAGQSRRALEGAYGRAVALVAEYPDDPQVRATLALLVRALHRMLRDGEAHA